MNDKSIRATKFLHPTTITRITEYAGGESQGPKMFATCTKSNLQCHDRVFLFISLAFFGGGEREVEFYCNYVIRLFVNLNATLKWQLYHIACRKMTMQVYMRKKLIFCSLTLHIASFERSCSHCCGPNMRSVQRLQTDIK